MVVLDYVVVSVGFGMFEGFELEVEGGFVFVFFEFVDGFGFEEDVEVLFGVYVEVVGFDGGVVFVVVDLDDCEVVVVFEVYGKKRKVIGVDEVEVVGFVRFDVNDGEGIVGGDFDLSLVGVIIVSVIRFGVIVFVVVLVIIIIVVVMEVVIEIIRMIIEVIIEEIFVFVGWVNGGLLVGGNIFFIEKNVVDFISLFERVFSNIVYYFLI